MKQFSRKQTLITRDLLHFPSGSSTEAVYNSSTEAVYNSPTGAAYSSSTEAVYNSSILSTAKKRHPYKASIAIGTRGDEERKEGTAARSTARAKNQTRQGAPPEPRIKPDKERRPGQESNPRERLRNRNGGAQARSGKDEDNGFRGKAQDEQQGHH